MPNDDAEFNVRELIRASMRGGMTSAAQIARAIAPLVPEDYIQAVLEQALTSLAHQVLTESHSSRPLTTIPAPTPHRPAAPSFQTQPPGFSTGRPAAPHRPTGHTRPVGRSVRRGEEIRDGWQRVLNAVYQGADGKRKQLRHFTVDDCEWTARQYATRAESNAARAREFRELARKLREIQDSRPGVETLDDMTAEEKQSVFG